jgi:hypothetical protein
MSSYLIDMPTIAGKDQLRRAASLKVLTECGLNSRINFPLLVGMAIAAVMTQLELREIS